MFQRVSQDLELKKQMVTMALVGTAVVLFESFLFFVIVTPQVNANIRRMLRLSEGPFDKDPMWQAVARCCLNVADAREQRLVKHNNQGAALHAALIAAMPLLLVLLMLTMSQRLRSSSWRSVWMDASITVVCIASFQVVFYFFGQRRRYSGGDAMALDVCEEYWRIHGTRSGVRDCGACADKLRKMMQSSPTAQRLQSLSPDAVLQGLLPRIRT